MPLRSLGLALLLCLSLATLARAQPRLGNRLALVVGNDAYTTLPKLKNAVADARAVAKALESLGFKVFPGENLDYKATNRLHANFAAALRPGDQAFLFFAGHGVALGAENYLLPVDMPTPQLGEEDVVRAESHGLDVLVKRVLNRGVAATFVVLDACRNNPFEAMGVRSIGAARGLVRVDAPTGVFVLFSAGIGQLALDRLNDQDRNPNSVFTRVLVPLLTTPGLSHLALAKQVQTQVRTLAAGVNHQQQPAFYDQVEGEIVFQPGPTPEPVKPVPPTPVPPTPPTPPRTITGQDGAPMVLVPAGEFSMGSSSAEFERLVREFPNAREYWEREVPQHRVFLDGFYIDTYEVTNARFQRFVQATGHRTTAEQEGWGWVNQGTEWKRTDGATWRAPRGPGSNLNGLERHPVVQVSQEDAKAYCAWAGKRLPTEAEWEKAARGTDGRRYPWGEQFEGTRLNFCDRNCEFSWKDQAVNDGYQYTAPVGKYEGGKSPYGAYDMAGNVWEWVADFYDKEYYKNSPSSNPQGPSKSDQAVVRGGSWGDNAPDVRAPPRDSDAPANRGGPAGFRCAKTL